MNGATRERGAAELQTKAQAETLKTQEAVTGAEAVTALIAVHSVQCGWQGRDRWSSQSVKGALFAVALGEVIDVRRPSAWPWVL